MTKTSSSTSSDLQLVCGLEIHAELKTKSKMFCSCKNDPFFAAAPNTHTCPVCLGMPGGLPVANRQAIEWTIKLGLALHCQINVFSKFDRKHYFYPDLPKGYQISQYDIPFCYDGYVETSQGKVRIRRIHLEEDTGKLQHKTVNDQKVSLIDFNRSGVPLVEIVTEPDIHSAEQAKEYGKKLRQILRYLDIADCDMEQGGMRLEANTSLKAADATELPTYKVEVKNINSFRFLEQAINFEIQRQALVLMEGQTPKQETRGWDSVHNTTFPQRTKEDAEDYRYFPDPDLPPIRLEQAHLDTWRAGLPELPDAVIARWEKTWGIEPRFSEQVIDSQADVAWFEEANALAQQAQLEPNKFVSAIVNKKLAVDRAQGQSPAAAIKAFQASQTVETIDTAQLATVIQQVVTENALEVERYRAGQTKLINFFLGQVMKKLQKKVDMAQIKTELETALG